MNVSSIIDPLYGFSSWSSGSNTIMPQNTSENMSFYANHHDNITLNLYLLPTITAFISGRTLFVLTNLMQQILVFHLLGFLHILFPIP